MPSLKPQRKPPRRRLKRLHLRPRSPLPSQPHLRRRSQSRRPRLPSPPVKLPPQTRLLLVRGRAQQVETTPSLNAPTFRDPVPAPAEIIRSKWLTGQELAPLALDQAEPPVDRHVVHVAVQAVLPARRLARVAVVQVALEDPVVPAALVDPVALEALEDLHPADVRHRAAVDAEVAPQERLDVRAASPPSPASPSGPSAWSTRSSRRRRSAA